MGRRLSGNGGSSPRAKTVNTFVTLTSGVVTTISRFGLLAPASYTKTGGSGNLTINAASGAVSAASALGAGVTQTLNGTVTAADGVLLPFVANLTGMVAVPGIVSLTLTAGSGQVSVAWTDGSQGGAPITAHRLYRGTTSGGEVFVTTLTGASPYVDGGLTNGVTYYYKLSAVNSGGEGPLSAEAGATPFAVGLPSAPSLTLTRGVAQVSVAWTDGAPGGAPITSHKLYRGTSPGGEALVGTILSSSPYVDGGLTNGTTYYYKLSAVSSLGEGALSSEASATPATVPGAPVVTPTAGNAQVSIAWTDGASGGSAITAHKLYRGTAAGGEVLVGTITTASPYVDAGLSNGTTYYYKLSAVNGVGEGALSAETSATPSAGAPSLVALAVSPSTATIGTAYSGTVGGKTAGSTLSLTGAGAAGLSVSGSTISGTPTTAGAVNLVETLAGSPNSPKTTNGVVTVSASSSYLAAVGSAPIAVYGTRRLISGYAGNLFTLRRSSDSATQSFACAGGGDLPDYAAINTWSGASTLYVTALFDQQGAAAPLVNATTTTQPKLETAQAGVYAMGAPLLMGDVSGAWYLGGGGFSFDRQNISYLAIASLLSSGVNIPLVNIESSGGAVAQCYYNASNQGRWTVYETASTYPTNAAWSPQSPSVTAFVSNTSERRFYYRGTSEAVAAGVAGTATNLRLGANAVFANPEVRIWGIAVYPALSQADMGALITSAKAACSINTAFDRRLVIGGDSIAYGAQYAHFLRNSQYYFSQTLSGNCEVVNRGIGGSTLTNLDTNYSSVNNEALDRFYTSGYGAGKCIVVIQRGINDLRASTSASAMYASLTSLVGKAKATGYKVGVCTLLPDGSSSALAGEDAARLAYNTSVRGNAAGADFVIDLAGNSTVGDGTGAQSNSTYSSDGLHYTDLGYSYLGPMYAAAVNLNW